MICCSAQEIIQLSLKKCIEYNQQNISCIKSIKQKQTLNHICIRSPKYFKKSLKKYSNHGKPISDQLTINKRKISIEKESRKKQKNFITKQNCQIFNQEYFYGNRYNYQREFHRTSNLGSHHHRNSPKIVINLVNNAHSPQPNHYIKNDYGLSIYKKQSIKTKLTPSSTQCTNSYIKKQSIVSASNIKNELQTQTSKNIQQPKINNQCIKSYPQIKIKDDLLLNSFNPKYTQSQESNSSVFQDQFSEVVQRFVSLRKFQHLHNI